MIRLKNTEVNTVRDVRLELYVEGAAMTLPTPAGLDLLELCTADIHTLKYYLHDSQ